MVSKGSRFVAAAAYLGIARHLPWSFRPGGRAGQSARRFLVGQMLESCGTAVDVEHGAWFGSGLGVRLGDRSAIGIDALIMGPVSIGVDVMMGPRCVILAGRHDTRSTRVPMNTQGFLADLPVVIEDDVWIGANVTILPGRRIGTGSIVGAGSVVTHDVLPFTVVGGNPARLIANRHDLSA